MKIETYVNNEEEILWKGKPNKAVFIKEHIFSPLLIFAAIWLVIDSGVLITMFSTGELNVQLVFIVPFFILHLMPVWIYLFGVIFAFSKWKNTEYLVSDKAIYALSGVFSTNCVRKTFQEVTNISVHQGIIDKRHNVGDIFIIAGVVTNGGGKVTSNNINIVDIEDYIRVYKLISKTGNDIFSDTMYPNDLRPKENHGYDTKYVDDELK